MSTALRACVLLLLLSCPGLAKADQYRLAASSINSAYHAAGVALEAVTSLYLMPDTNIKLASVSTAGVRDNIELLSNGEVDFAIIPSLLGFHARTGTGVLSDLGPQKDLRAIAMLVPTHVHALLRTSLVQSGTIDDLLTLSSRQLKLGRNAIEAESVARLLLLQQPGTAGSAFYGLPPDTALNPAAFLDGEIDGLVTTGALPDAEIEEMLALAANNLTMLTVTDEQLRHLNNGFDLVVPATIPAGTYLSQDKDIRTVALPVFLATRADVDEEAVYQIARIMFEQVGFLRTINPAMEGLDFETAIDHLPVPLHPGAARYYRDFGLSVADSATSAPDYAVYAIDAEDPERRRIETNSGVVGIMVDPDATSLQAASELAVVVNAEPSDVRVVVQRGEGASKTVNDLLYMKGVDLGVVQADVLNNLRNQEGTDWLPNQLRYLAKLYDSDAHLLVRNDIEKIQNLAGKTVNFGPIGSASEITAANIFSQLGLAVERSSDPFAFALEKLERGDIDAIVVCGAKPMPSLASMGGQRELKLLDIPHIGLLDVYQQSSITSEDYPNLVQPGESVSTVSVPSMLMAYRWPETSDRYQLLSAFFDIFEERLGELQVDDRFHPTWQDVSLTAELDGWTKSPIAAESPAPASASGQANGDESNLPSGLPSPPASPLPIPEAVR